MPFVSEGLTDLYRRRQESPEPTDQGGHILSAIWSAVSPETKRVFDKYMGGQYEGAGWQDVAADLLPESPYMAAQPAMGMTKVIGVPGGNRTIQAFHDKTGQYLGSLGYKDFPGKGAVFQSIQSESPRGTAELLGRFRDEMGPLMNEVKVPGPIKAQSVPAFESMLNRGRLNEYPDLAKRLRSVLDESRANYGDLIPENTYQWNKYQR